MNHKSKHPAWVFDENNVTNKYDYISITHSKFTRGNKNIKLPDNPEVGDLSDSYILPKPQKESKSRFSSTKKKMIMTKRNLYWFYRVKNRKK